MHAGAPDPARQQVESWLAEHARADEDLATCRHRQVLFCAIAATIAGVVSILA
jgi:anti-sigma factor RsiW